MLNNKSLQAFLAIAPPAAFFICMIGYFIFFFSMFTQMENFDNDGEPELPMAMFGGFAFFFVMVILTSLLSLFSWIYFIIHAVKNPNMNDNNNQLVVWILILVLVSFIGPFIYWLVEIRMKNPKPVIPN